MRDANGTTRWLAAILLAGMVGAMARAGRAEEIGLTRDGGVYKVPIVINGQVMKLAVVDSGASEVHVPAEVVATLYPETLRSEDFLEGHTYRLADGRMIQSDRFRLRTLKVGSREFRDVPAVRGNPQRIREHR